MPFVFGLCSYIFFLLFINAFSIYELDKLASLICSTIIFCTAWLIRTIKKQMYLYTNIPSNTLENDTLDE